ncbi:tyrosine-protein phosphatase [Aurantiacibacter spongiae]|nr:tyrosine-protein phosphatase [Aurantiacibacter spongiae]
MTLRDEDRLRIVTLEGAGNFRDFGGYRTQGGRRVATGRLYRANRLSHLTPRDIAALDARGITTIFDLRSVREREADPTAWTGEHLTAHSWPPGHKRRLVDMARDYPQTAAGARALMLDFYGELPLTLGHAFGAIITRIAAGAVPCVIHCSAGKDRTGMAAALVLAALGVPRETILDDYAMTDRIVASADDMARSIFTGRRGGERAQGTMQSEFPEEMIAVMLSARPEFLESAFAGIERAHGGLDEYLEAIGVTDAMRENLTRLLLEPPLSPLSETA